MSSTPSPINVAEDERNRSWELYKRRLFLAVGVIAGLIVFASFVSTTLSVLLLLFLCVLMAVGLRGLSDQLAKHSPLPDKAALALVVLVMLALIVGAGMVVGPNLEGQFSQLGATLPQALSRLENQLRQYSWGQPLAEQIPTVSQLEQQIITGSSDTFARITGIFSSALSALSSALVVVFIALYLAIEPKTYVDNFLRLIPPEKRNRMHQALDKVGETLAKWLLTRLVSMILVGILTTIGLMFMGMPLTLSLGIIAAIGAFIPTFGPIIALVPAVLVALMQSPQQALWVALLYTSIQMIDNYLVSPFLQKSMLYLPPAYIVAAQLLFGVIAGPLGLILAAPLAAALVILVRMLYVEDVLRDYGHQRDDKPETE